MSNNASLFPLAAAGVTAFTLAATILFAPGFAHAAEPAATAACPNANGTTPLKLPDRPALNLMTNSRRSKACNWL